MKEGVFAADILAYAHTAYGTEGEHLWLAFPAYAVLRHPKGKWYGVIMDVDREKLGLPDNGRTEILVAKCDPAAREFLLAQPGFLPGYHLDRNRWITILLDGSVPKELAFRVLDDSFAIIGGQRK